jgi:tRNA 2-thiouridine synthesizing protein E
MEESVHPGAVRPSPGFPDAPESWSPALAEELAREMGIELTDEHWEVIRTLQGAYRDEPEPPLRRLHEALEGRFSEQGCMKYLYVIFKGGPIARGCKLAGLTPPAGAIDISFGSEA